MDPSHTRSTKFGRSHSFRMVRDGTNERVKRSSFATSYTTRYGRRANETDGDPDSGSGSESSDSEGESEDEINSTDQEGSTKTLSIQTQTIEVEAGGGASLPNSIFTDPTNGQGQLKLSTMWETVNEFDTSVGRMTEKCLISAEDPSQKFCETLLNGAVLGSGDGSSVTLVTSATVAATQTSVEVTPTATATEGGISPTPATSEDPITTSAREISSSFLTTDTPPTTLSETLLSSTVSEIITSPTAASISDLNPPPATTSSATETSISVDFTVNPQPADATAAAASESAETVSIPGQQLKVLPIGLGILGGLAGIAILVVLYVTHQRRKFKKQFRSRKLAEEPSPMGTGGGTYGSA